MEVLKIHFYRGTYDEVIKQDPPELSWPVEFWSSLLLFGNPGNADEDRSDDESRGTSSKTIRQNTNKPADQPNLWEEKYEHYQPSTFTHDTESSYAVTLFSHVDIITDIWGASF